MSAVHLKTSNEAASPPSSPSQARPLQKMAPTNLGSPLNSTVNWSPERVFSPGLAVGYKTPLGIEYVNGTVELFVSGSNSQGLIKEEDLVLGASVTTTITTKTARKAESKGTFIQYDKSRVSQANADFQVSATNRKGQVNYQGGHLIDHKYSAGSSHTTEENYFPQHFMINAPFKEHLVQHCDAFVEIPLYTPNPPTIGVKGQKDKVHPIPIGEVFIQITQNAISALYFFPNNYDYEGLKQKLGVTTQIAATLTPYFKLKPAFYPLFLPALITQFGNAEEKKEQAKNEAEFIDLMDEVTYGMAQAECEEEETDITRLAFSVVHEEHVDPSQVLECTEEMWSSVEDQSLQLPFDAFGKFIVTYVIRNALKSEVLSIHSRLVFLSGVIDFIEAYSQVNDEVLEFIDTFVDEFKTTFEELERIKHTMSKEELFYFTDLYRRISDSSNDAFSTSGYNIYFRATEEFFTDFVKQLMYISSKYKVEDFDTGDADRFLNFIRLAQNSLNYWIETGVPEKEFETQDAFLKSMIEPCSKLFDRQNAEGRISSTTFQTNINRQTTLKALPSHIRTTLENLGLSDSESE